MAGDAEERDTSERMRAAYRKVRKKVPPPAEVLPDRRKRREADRARREIQREMDER